jgi:putative transposase
MILDLIAQIRFRMPRIGGRKLYYLLAPHFKQNGIVIGRDGLFTFMRERGLLVKPRRRYCVTTNSNHWLRKHPNLLVELNPTGREQVLVSDITYVETGEGFVYLFLITDGYSRKILGYHVSVDMRAESALIALKMAVKSIVYSQGIIHHSDRGVQYCSELYVDHLTKLHMHLSMTEPSSPTQNAIAERVNGILKTEWIYHKYFETRKDAQKEIPKIIKIYNEERPHDSLGKLTPSKAHELNSPIKKLWRKRSKLLSNYDATKYGGDLRGMGCSECQQNEEGHLIIEWPSCDIRHRPQVIPRTNKSPQVRPPLHQGESNILLKRQSKQIHLQTN